GEDGEPDAEGGAARDPRARRGQDERLPAAEETVEVVTEVLGRRVPVGARDRGGLLRDRLERGRRRGREPPERRALPAEDLPAELVGSPGVERPRARDALEQDEAERVDVDARVDVALAPDLFGRHVERRPDRVAGAREALDRARVAGEAEVRDPGRARRRVED